MLLTRLNVVARHIAEGYFHVEKQRKLVERLIRDGHEEVAVAAAEILASFEDILDAHKAHRESILEELENAEKDSTHEIVSDIQSLKSSHAVLLDTRRIILDFRKTLAETWSALRLVDRMLSIQTDPDADRHDAETNVTPSRSRPAWMIRSIGETAPCASFVNSKTAIDHEALR